MDKILEECINQLKVKGLTSSEYKERLMKEYSTIRKLGYMDYMLIVQDIIQYAKNNNILTGIARGSVAGSLMAYLMGITGVNPIEHNLLFERFLNLARGTTDPPDIDMDFQASRRDDIKRYIEQKYKNVCAIGSYSRLHASSALRDVAKALMVDDELNDVIAHKLYGITLEQAKDILASWIYKNPKNQRAFEIAQKLEGIIRHKTVHASGVLVLPRDILNTIPVSMINGVMCSQWEDTIITQLGYLKLDILGLSILDIIKEVISQIDINLEALTLDDKKVLYEFTKGNTLGVFQFETNHLKRITMSLGITCFNDLVMATTIARPSSWRGGITDSIIEYRHKKKKFQCLKGLEGLLDDTYGYPIYQEQIMKVMNVVGGISLEDTELIRDAIKHLNETVIQHYHEKFLDGAIQNGLTRNDAEQIWQLLENAGKYTFNKAHAVSYSIISYWCMYLKTYYTLEYLTAYLNNESDETKRNLILQELSRRSYKIYPVDINLSSEQYKKDGDGIRLGFCHIKGISKQIAYEIIKNQPYKDLTDFIQKTDRRKCNKKIIELLQSYGAISSNNNLFGDTTVVVSNKQYNPEGLTYKMIEAWMKYLEIEKWRSVVFESEVGFLEEIKRLSSYPKLVLGLGEDIRNKLGLTKGIITNCLFYGKLTCNGICLDDPEYYAKNWTVTNRKRVKRMLDQVKTLLATINQ